MFKWGTSQQPRLSTPLSGRRCQVCTWYAFNAWSSLMHGGRSAPKDTKCVPEGPTKGFGHSVNETVTLPRNDAGSNGYKIKAYFILQKFRLTTQYRAAPPTHWKKCLQGMHSIKKYANTSSDGYVSVHQLIIRTNQNARVICVIFVRKFHRQNAWK